MNGRIIARASVVALAIVALGAGAATLDAGTVPDPEPEVPDLSGNGSYEGNGSRENDSLPLANLSSPPSPVPFDTCQTGPERPRQLVVAFAGLAVLAALVARRTDSMRYAAFLLGFPAVGLFAGCSSLLLALRNPLADLLGIAPPRVALVGGLLAVLAGVVVVGLLSSGDSPVSTSRAETDEAADLAAVGRAAGDAADRIDRNADPTNEVYRAWRRMATGLDVSNPDARSPAEFAAAASDAGMAREHVSTLTRLFREVRYGGLDPDDRAERAVEALRRIEDAYGGDDQ